MSVLVRALAVFAGLAAAGCSTTEIRTASVVERPRVVHFSPTLARDSLSRYRQSAGLSVVSLDPSLTAFAQAQANAMAAKDTLSHDVAGSFPSRLERVGLANRHAAENIAFGNYTEEDTLMQWRH